jgi:hypothetical protein
VATAIEVARRRLRQGYRLDAAELLDRCVQALGRDRLDDGLLAERWAYAQDRRTGNGPTGLPPDVLQRVIVWVTREELAAGEHALAADRPFAAARFLMAADRIDARGTRSAFVHALALHRAAQKSLDRAAEAERAGPVQRILVEIIGTPAGAAVAAAGAILQRLDGAVPVLLHGEEDACWPLVAHAGRLGLPTRIGLEDTLSLPDGTPAADNAALVRAAIAVWERAQVRQDQVQ